MKEFPKELVEDALELLGRVVNMGKIKKGTNEVTKSIERGLAKLVFIAIDVDPPEIVRHLSILASEKNIRYIYVPSSKDLGDSSGLDVSCASSAIINSGKEESALKSILERVNEFN